MPIPDYQSLMLPLLRVAAQGDTRVPSVSEKIADELGLTERERAEMLPNGKQRVLHNRVHWAKFCMSKAGLIESRRRGVFKATEAGNQLLAKAPAKIDVKLLKQFPSFADFLTATNSHL